MTTHSDDPSNATKVCSVCIVLDHDGNGKGKPNGRFYHPGDLLSGHLEIWCDSKVVIEESLVAFEGTTRTWVKHGELLGGFSTRDYNFLKQVQKLSHDLWDVQQTDAGSFWKMQFQFRIFGQRFPNEGLNQQFAQLPPSLSDGDVLFDHRGQKCMQPLISYAIHATVAYRATPQGPLRRAQNICGINLMPLAQAGPPLSIDDFPGEFKLACRADLRKRVSNRVVGDIQISMNEPRPLAIFADGVKKCCGEGLLNLKIRTRDFLVGCRQPQKWKYQLESQIRMKTFYSTLPIGEMASNCLMQKNHFLRVRTENVHFESRPISLISWDYESMNVGADQMTSITASLPFAICIDNQLIPNFCGPLSTRRYCLQVQLRIQGVRHSPLVLVSPLQIFHSRHDQDEACQTPCACNAWSESDLRPRLIENRAEQTSMENELLPDYDCALC